MCIARFSILVGALVACAKVGPPSGGAVDRSPPKILAHQPPEDATGVSLEAPVEIVFSEAMERERTEGAIFITPDSGVRYRWRGARLVLVFSAGLQPDRTYVVTVGTGARDLRRNALEKSFTFAFATGDEINQGGIAGQVFSDHELTATAHVWAYDLDHFAGVIGSDEPAYRTQSGGDGSYEFSRLAAANYRLLAFVDGNGNQIYDVGERLALPPGDVRLEEGAQARVGDLALFQPLRTVPRLRRVQAVHRRRLLLEFVAPTEARQVEVALKGLEVEGLYGVPQEENKVHVLTAPQEPGHPYSFEFLQVLGQAIEWKEPVRGSGRQDRTPPALVDKFPDGQDMVAGDTLKLVFSEAMQAVDPVDFWLQSDSTQAIEGRWQWQNKTSLQFVPEHPYEPGNYRLQGLGDLLRDLGGLSLQDSLVGFEFEVLAVDRLASLQGYVAGGTETSWVVAQSRKQARVRRVRADANGYFILESLLPGAYTVFAFEDQNANGLQDYGSLEPFEPAEPYSRYLETVILSAGDRAEGIDLEFP